MSSAAKVWRAAGERTGQVPLLRVGSTCLGLLDHFPWWRSTSLMTGLHQPLSLTPSQLSLPASLPPQLPAASSWPWAAGKPLPPGRGLWGGKAPWGGQS